MADLMTKPLIGVTGGRVLSAIFPGIPPGTAHIPVDTSIAAYGESIAAAGGIPVHVTRISGSVDILDRLDGLVIAGGSDIDPRRYGSTPGPGATTVDPDRDEHEILLTRSAIERGLPFLGICRGMQVLNVARGGTLVSHLPPDVGEAHSFIGYPGHSPAHRVVFRRGSQLHRIYGDEVGVNSFHHQAVRETGAGLVVSAQADDGVIEAIEMEGADVLAVQWHPELMPDSAPLFSWLIARAMSRDARGLDPAGTDAERTRP